MKKEQLKEIELVLFQSGSQPRGSGAESSAMQYSSYI